ELAAVRLARDVAEGRLRKSLSVSLRFFRRRGDSANRSRRRRLGPRGALHHAAQHDRGRQPHSPSHGHFTKLLTLKSRSAATRGPPPGALALAERPADTAQIHTGADLFYPKQSEPLEIQDRRELPTPGGTKSAAPARSSAALHGSNQRRPLNTDFAPVE